MATLFRLVRLFRLQYWAFLAIAFVAALGETAADLLQPWPIKFVFDNIFDNKPLPPEIASFMVSIFGSVEQGILPCVLGAIIAIAALNAASSFVQAFFMTRVGHRVLFDLRSKLYWHIQGLSLAYHDERRTGNLISTLTGDIQAVQDMIETAVLGLGINTLTLMGMVVIMLTIDWRFTLLALSIAPILFVVVYRLTRRIKQVARDVRRKEGEIASIAQEVLSSIRVVQAFTREDFEQARFERENRERVSAGVQARTLQAQLTPLVELLVAIGTVLVLWYSVGQVRAGLLTPGALLVFLAYLSRLYKPMRNLSKLSDVVSRASVGLERIYDILKVERTVKVLPRARAAPRLRGKIEFEDVSFTYHEGKPFLKNISLNVQPGQLVALVGATGAGKTTLLSMIPRFNVPDKGRIAIDDMDVRRFTLSSLRSQISLVLQETILFHGTIRDNIVYGRPGATHAQLLAAAEAANAHEFIRKLPQGYLTMIGERGVTLSGGQRQRLAIARAIIRDAPIILLDEPTTGLDANAEALVMDGLARLIAGRTTVVIAHRLTTINRADLILVMEDGEIIERGTHRDLLAAGGRYAEFYALQFRSQASVRQIEPAMSPTHLESKPVFNR